MNKKQSFLAIFIVIFLCSIVFAQTPQQLASEILTATGVNGGLVVHYGCGDGQLTVALHDSDSFLVHGLDANESNVDAARAYIKSQGLYGYEITAEHYTGSTLPYIENLVTLFVSEVPLPFDTNEILRVLAPNGIAYVKDGNDWNMTVKPRPADIDDWTHFLYDASNNAVSKDTIVGPPRRFQWHGSPMWARHHDRMASVSAFVSANDRVFYIMDMGSKVSFQLPPDWYLIARDAFNGTILWKKPIASWLTHMWPAKCGPAQLPRRLVAIGDKVFVTLGLDGTALSCLDAVTGNELWTSPTSTTVMTEELIYSDGTLFTMVKGDPNETTWNDFRPLETWLWTARDRASDLFPWNSAEIRKVTAIDPNNGSVIWQKDYPIAPLSLAADANGVYFHDGNGIICLDRGDGSKKWESASVAIKDPLPPKTAPTLVVKYGYVFYEDANKNLTTLLASTGQILWSDTHPATGHHCPYDLFVRDGKAWVGAIAGKNDSGEYTGWDPASGSTVVEYPCDTNALWMHHRCYRAKATEKYFISSRMGIEFVDPCAPEQHWEAHNWVRSGCVYGVMPSNGLIYATPHSCACFYQAQLYGFCTLAPKHDDPNYPQASDPNSRLTKGPAYNEPNAPDPGAEDWPTYRGDPGRSGYVKSVVPAELELEWQNQLEGELTSPVVANGKVYLASKDIHTLYCLNESTGQTKWTFIAGGRIDSPPSIYKGRVIFGCADGYVYCLRASDAEIIWKFQAAPLKLKLTAFEQVESVWPLSGSVLIINDTIYCIAGRSMFLDGGLRMILLDPVTGNLISENVMDEFDPATGTNLQFFTDGKTMPVALPDILSSDGEMVFMRSERFNMQGIRTKIYPELGTVQKGDGIHLFSPTGYLDGTYFHRTNWIYGINSGESYGEWHTAGKHVPAGKILAFDDDETVYGFGRLQEYYTQTPMIEYKLFAAKKYPSGDNNEYFWEDFSFPVLVRGIVIADKTLFVAGPADVVDEADAFFHWSMDLGDPNYDATIPDQLIEQNEALKDNRGGILRAVSTWDGQTLAEYNLESIPAWDGLIAANGRLYIAMANGKIKCFKGTNYPPSIDAGADQTIFPMVAVVLDANATDDGLPRTDPNDPNSPPLGMTCSWSKIAGPGDVSFGDPNNPDTAVSFSTWGNYTLRLSATDGSAFYADDIDIKIYRPGDLDDDNDVDIDDITLFVDSWLAGDCNEDNNWCLGADQASEGSVEMSSYDVMALNWLAGAIPAKPTGVNAGGAETQITITWDENTDHDLAGYNLYRTSTSGSGYTKLNTSLLTDTNFVDVTAGSFTTMYYVVAAEDTFGYQSPNSNQASASKGPQPDVKLLAGIGVTYDPVTFKVSNWNDQANNNDAKQSDDPNKPIYIASAINGHPAIEFNASDQHLEVSDSDHINKNGPFSAKTLLVVFKTSGDIISKQVIWEQGGGKVGGLNFYIQDSSVYINGWTIKDDEYPDWGLTGVTLNIPISTNSVYLATMVMDSGSGTFEGFVNGSSIGVYTGIDVLPSHGNNCGFGHTEGSSRFVSGGHSNVANFVGQIAEFYEFNSVLSTSDRTALENILLSKYNISP